MQFITLLAAAAAFAGVNAVQFTNPAFNNLTAGQPFEFTWASASGPVTIELKNGPSTNLKTVSTITTGQTGTSFTWPVPATLPADTYAFEIKDASGSNYSPQVQIIGATGSASASISSAVSSASSAISSASSSLSAAISSITAVANATTASASASGSAIPSGGANSTITTGRPTGTTTRAPGSPSTTAGGAAGGASGTAAAPPNSGVGSDFASPLALVFLTFAAIFTLN